MMDERTSRIFIGMCLLALVWIGVYWMWQPTRDQKPPAISFAQPKPTETQESAPTQPATVIDRITTARPDSEQNPEPARPTVVPPEFIEHTVKDKQTMQSIAEQYFGSGENWGIIARANPFVDPQKLRPGMTIRIPKDPDNIQGRVDGRQIQPGVIESHIGEQSATIEYVVRPGDSLSRISQRIYGSARHARFIYDNNRETLKSMDDISVGQLLRLPPIPQPDGSSP